MNLRSIAIAAAALAYTSAAAYSHLELPSLPAAEVISEAQGQTTYYDRTAYGWYIYAGGNNLQYGKIPGGAKVVWADDGATAYLQNPLTADQHGTYIRCSVEGNKLKAEFPQTLAMLDDGNTQIPLYIGRMVPYDMPDGSGVSYVPAEDADFFTWTIAADGKITLDNIDVAIDSNGKFKDGVPKSILGTYYYVDDDPVAIWNAVGDWAQTYTPIETQEITNIPTGIPTEAWQLTTKTGSRMVDVAVSGDKMYIANLSPYGDPGAAIVGDIADGKVSFATGQYVGFNEKNNGAVWFLTAIAVYTLVDWGDYQREYLSEFKRTQALVFDYDADAKTLTSNKNDCYLINSTLGDTSYYEYQVDPCLHFLPEEGMNAAPAAPKFLDCNDYGEPEGYLFRWEIPAVNVDGVDLNTNRMHYRIYVNGAPYTFYPDTYYKVGEPKAELAYNYTDSYDIYQKDGAHCIYFHGSGIENIGIVSCFQGTDGKLYESEIVNTNPDWIPDTYVPEDNPGVFDPAGHRVTTFAYATKDAACEPAGTGRAETYDIAIALTNPNLAGKAVTSIQVPVFPSAAVTGLCAWVTPRLTLLYDPDTQANVNAVAHSWPLEMPASGSGMQFVTLELPQPYVIPAEGLYVGYSLTVSKLDKNETTLCPVATMLGSKDGSLYIHTTRSFLNWADRSAELGAVSMLQVGIAGDILQNAASLGEIPHAYYEAGKDAVASVSVHNLGMEPISSLAYTATIGDASCSGTITLDTPIQAVFSYAETVSFALPAVDEIGEREVEICITEVNGAPNEADGTARGMVHVLDFIPKHVPLVEEFTGTWCGWCPRGFVAMEKMAELYPDFVGIAYHSSDPMEMLDGYPLLNSGFPSASLSRRFTTDPFYGDDEKGFGFRKLWERCRDEFTPVAISAQASCSTDGIVTVTSQVEWALVDDEIAASDYRIEYVLMADDLHSTSRAWRQHNYYATEPLEEYMEQFCGNSEYISDLHFNDVAILTSGLSGVPGSIKSVETGVVNEHTYRFDLSSVATLAGTPLPIDRNKMRVAAFVLRLDGSQYGQVLNSTKCVVTDGAGISGITADEEGPAQYYNLQGLPVAHPRQGEVYIKVAPGCTTKILYGRE